MKFKNGLETTIKNYLNNIAIADDSLTGIQISVLKFEISEVSTKQLGTIEVEKPTPIINQNICSPITLDNNLFKYQNRSFKTINELIKLLLDCGNEEVVKIFKNYQRNYKLSNIAAIACGGIFGYQARTWLVSG